MENGIGMVEEGTKTEDLLLSMLDEDATIRLLASILKTLPLDGPD